MVEATLLVAAILTYGVATTYAFVGWRLARAARAHDAAGQAVLFFAVWWLSTSLNQFLGSTLYLAAAFGYTDVSAQLAYVVLQRFLLSLSLVALMHYLIYLQTGRNAIPWLAAIYGAYWFLAVYDIVRRGPIGVESFGWRTDLVFADPEITLFQLLQLVIVLPPVIGAASLLRLYRKVEGRERRLRIGMLGIGFVVWWVTAVVSGNPATFDIAWLQMANRLVGISVALGIFYAYEPTGWMRRRYRLERQALS